MMGTRTMSFCNRHSPSLWWCLAVVVWLQVSSFVLCENRYDFIVVGGGTGGCAVARRLGENGKYSVLVLESGGMMKPNMSIPALASDFYTDRDVSWGLRTTRQPNAGLAFEGVLPILAGKVMGGTASFNGMFWNRGSPLDWDNWANLTNDTSWNYANMLRYFRKMEKYEGEFESDQHGYDGPITVSSADTAPGLDTWLNAGRELNYPVFDTNGPQRPSFAPVEFNKKFGRRDNSYKGYLEPILASNTNVKLMINTNATEIIFEDKRAVGVRFERATRKRGVRSGIMYANKEIVISSGAYGSPVLLLRSGIGPRKELEALKIPVVQDLPVGKSFQDHMALALNFVINDTTQVAHPPRDFTPENLELWNTTGKGPFTIAGGATGQAFIVTSVPQSEGHPDWADIHLTMAHSTVPYLFSGGPSYEVNLAPGEVVIQQLIFLTRPKSRGSVSLNPEDIHDIPLIDSNFLSDAEDKDMTSYIDGIEKVMEAMQNTKPYQRLGARYAPINFPACKDASFGTRDYWRCYVRHASLTGCHPGGSVRMGSGPSDPVAVLDPKLRVIGIQGLRVADASIFPALPNANTQVPTYAIAEKAADMILQDLEKGQHQPCTRIPTFQYCSTTEEASISDVNVKLPVSLYISTLRMGRVFGKLISVLSNIFVD